MEVKKVMTFLRTGTEPRYRHSQKVLLNTPLLRDDAVIPHKSVWCYSSRGLASLVVGAQSPCALPENHETEIGERDNYGS